jgi:SAM-dependent methyltransferase
MSSTPSGQAAERAQTEDSARAAELQALYYRRTAADYDAMHVHEDDGHAAALRFISALMDPLQIGSLLDVGCGTGRAVRHFVSRHSGMRVRGAEPSRALIEQAVARNGVPAGHIACARGESLPYPDGSFDAVCEFGILHHVPDPNAVVREMLRVARRAVFLSDANRFGQGSWTARVGKLLLYRLKLWPLANYVKTRGRGYVITDGDGLAYSYSVFDSYDLLARWGSQVILVPTSPPSARSWAHPLLTAGQVLACAIRE